MQRKAVSQQTEMNWSPVVVVVAARNASYPQGIAPSTSTGFHALLKIAAPGPHTPAARYLRPSHSIP